MHNFIACGENEKRQADSDTKEIKTCQQGLDCRQAGSDTTEISTNCTDCTKMEPRQVLLHVQNLIDA